MAACAPPDLSELRQSVEVSVTEGPTATHARFVAFFESAEDTLHVALPAGVDTALSDALTDAWDRGVEVEVVTDFDRSAEPAILAITDAGIPLRLADGAIAYFDFSENEDLTWESEDVIMSHAYAIADGTRILNATSAGTTDEGDRIVFEALNQDLGEDLHAEHVQVFGGNDATALDAYSASNKNVADPRWIYGTADDTRLEVWFGPQERLTKRIIDATYGARASVWVLTDDFANEGLALALQAKAADGFDVRVVVGSRFGDASSAMSQTLENDTPDVEKSQIQASIRVPTLVLVDYAEGRDGRRHTARAMVLSHDLYAAERLYGGRPVRTDQRIDGNLWVLDDYDDLSDPMLLFQDLFDAHADQAVPL
jgi:phosphatidylserine/phosphatidylglycerophosphate/cardiolipin synthase-like enzyme